ncbi:LPS translocon maturation chaperone LptM [Yanghanlia caeni]|uniref:Lipoprotein n=1 Tax=Yanghanlia caeni TaxID=3064283 RepID=A0ABU1D214_9BURK|nr:lipoprotein [Alcaligenaceae bacterium LG-2]NGR08998.1 hypothetical protein [bacterium SGD-2]
MTLTATPLLRGSARLLGGLVLAGGLAACGYKGPLYLPPPEDPPASLTEPPGHEAAPPTSPN